MSRPQPGFAAVDPPERWAPTRGRFRPERLEAPLDSLPGVGPTLKKRLAKLGLERVGDLLDHRPRRYERPAPERRIADLFGEEEVLIEGEVLRTSLRRGRGRLQILTAQVSDGTGQISATWFNQPWLQDKLKPGTHVRLRGAPNRFGFAVRSFDLNGGSATADFAPVYPASEEISAAKLRELVEAALPLVTDRPDPLPAALKAERGLPLRGDALASIHKPRSLDEAEEGRQRLAFDELLVLQLALARRTAEREQQVAAALPEPGELIGRYRAALPFELTEHQEEAIAEIDADLARTTPMQRLLQGDVGSGKTVVALYALLRAVEAGRQGALMAPTETLAEQHFLTIEGLCMELGVSCALRDRLGQVEDRRPGGRRRRHARADPEGLRVPRPRRRGRRRAAPLRRRAALGARRGPSSPRPAHDGDADPAHARAHCLRRPRGQRDRKAAGEPKAGCHRLGHGRAQLGGVHAPARAPDRGPPGVRGLPADRGVRDVDRACGGGGGGAAAARAS